MFSPFQKVLLLRFVEVSSWPDYSIYSLKINFRKEYIINKKAKDASLDSGILISPSSSTSKAVKPNLLAYLFSHAKSTAVVPL